MFCALLSLALLSGNGGGSPATTSLEDFESFSIADGQAMVLDVSVLDENTVTNGQGPGLVGPGCIYSGIGIQWNGNNYYGQTSRNIQAEEGLLLLSYITPVEHFSLNLSAFDGYPDTAYLYIYDPIWNLIDTLGPYSVPSGTPVPVSYSAANIGYVQVTGVNHYWSPMIDDHEFGAAAQDFELSASGVPGGTMSFDVSGATASGWVALCYAFGAGSHSGMNPFTGNVVTTGLSSTQFTVGHLDSADAAGVLSYSTFVPPAAAGLVHVQAIDLSSDRTSSVLAL